jgi:multiple sugar transport system substrate-binding protein
MEELELSIMARGRDPAGDLQPFLDQFAALYRCRVRVKVLPWETAWADLVKVALYSSGPDVSEVGMNWVGNLVAMDSLRPFHMAELDAVGGASAFLESAWKSGWMMGDKRLWAVPWLADTRVIYYRRDLLERAGVDETTAASRCSAVTIGALANPQLDLDAAIDERLGTLARRLDFTLSQTL